MLNFIPPPPHAFSVIDFGCGVGGWLHAIGKDSAIKLTGVDGPWVNENELFSDKIDFIKVNLSDATEYIKLENLEKHDLAISLEVAEHIEEDYAQTFIDTICKTSDIVIFSAAIPHQGGDHHINEQTQSYWIEKFSKNDYLAYDLFRPYFWTEKK